MLFVFSHLKFILKIKHIRSSQRHFHYSPLGYRRPIKNKMRWYPNSSDYKLIHSKLFDTVCSAYPLTSSPPKGIESIGNNIYIGKNKIRKNMNETKQKLVINFPTVLKWNSYAPLLHESNHMFYCTYTEFNPFLNHRFCRFSTVLNCLAGYAASSSRPNKFSVGLRLEERPGQNIKSNSLAEIHRTVIRLVWIGAFSCWDIKF